MGSLSSVESKQYVFLLIASIEQNENGNFCKNPQSIFCRNLGLLPKSKKHGKQQKKIETSNISGIHLDMKFVFRRIMGRFL